VSAPRSVKVPQPVSRAIGTFQLTRALTVRVLAAIHQELPQATPQHRSARIPGDDRCFAFRILLPEGDVQHLFVLKVDDATSSDQFIVEDVRHFIRPV